MRTCRSLLYGIGACCLAALAVTGAAAQNEAAVPSVSVKLDTAIVSKYVWRGLVLNPDPAIQPSLTLTHKSGVSFNWWGSLDTTDANGQRGNFTEIDYTLNYGWNAGKVGVNAGLIDYTFPNTPFHGTSEAYGSACFGGLLNPTLSVNYDFDEADGFYASLAAGYACTMPWKKEQPTNLNLSARVSYGSPSYNRFYFGADKGAFTDLLLTASVPFQAGKVVTITPAVSYSTVLDGSLRDRVSKPDNFFAGVTASVAF
jgi:uncharacterized protein (TIGR02001 family)